MFPEGGGRGIKKCVGGEQIFSEVASKNHHRNLKYFTFLLCADYKAATVKINVGKKKKRSKIYLIFLVICSRIPNFITQHVSICSHKRCRFP